MKKVTLARDKISQAYLGLWGGEKVINKTRDRIDWLAKNAQGPKILDVGCSEGILAILLAREGNFVTGIDINPDALSYANSLLQNESDVVRSRITFQLESLFSLSQKQSVYDTVVIAEVIEHLYDPKSAIKNALSQVKPEGRILLTTPFGYFPDPDHRQTFKLTHVIHLLETVCTIEHTSVKNGYIRIIGRKSDSFQQCGKEDKIKNILEIVEQASIDEQIRFREEIKELFSKNEEFNVRNKQLVSKNEQLVSKNEQLVSKNEQLVSKNKQLVSKNEQLVSKNEELLSRSEAQNKRTLELRTQNQELTTNTKVLEKELSDIVVSHKKVAQQLNEIKKIADNLKKKNKEIKETLSWKLGYVTVKAFKYPGINTIFWLPRLAKILFFRFNKSDNSLSGKESQEKISTIVYTIEEKNKLLEEIIKELKEYCHKHPTLPLVVLNSTAKPFKEIKHINYRSTFMAKELKSMGYPTIFAYYNWDKNEEIESGQEPPLFEIPADRLIDMSTFLAELDIPNPKVFICAIPDIRSLRIFELFKQSGFYIFYDNWDDHEEMKKVDLARWFNKNYEQYIALHSHKVFVVSSVLKKKMFNLGVQMSNCRILPNGVTDQFKAVAASILETNEKILHKKNEVGYFGNLTKAFFDWESVLSVAKKLPKITFNLIGPNAPKDINIPHNIRLHGPVSHGDLNKYVKNWGCAIIPFKNDLLTSAVDPVKIYEYLSFGIPVVSVYMEQIEKYPLVSVYKDTPQFLEMVKKSLKLRSEDVNWVEVSLFLDKSTWRERVNTLFDEI